MALVDTRAECTLTHGNSERHPGVWVATDGYGGSGQQTIRIKTLCAPFVSKVLPGEPYGYSFPLYLRTLSEWLYFRGKHYKHLWAVWLKVHVVRAILWGEA